MIGKRKVIKQGASAGIGLTKEMQEVMGVGLGDTLTVTSVGHVLVLRKEGTPPLSPADLQVAQEEEPEVRAPFDHLRPADAHIVAVVAERGPIRTGDIAVRVYWSREHTSKVVNRLGREGWLEAGLTGWVLGPLGRGWVASIEQ